MSKFLGFRSSNKSQASLDRISAPIPGSVSTTNSTVQSDLQSHPAASSTAATSGLSHRDDAQAHYDRERDQGPGPIPSQLHTQSQSHHYGGALPPHHSHHPSASFSQQPQLQQQQQQQQYQSSSHPDEQYYTESATSRQPPAQPAPPQSLHRSPSSRIPSNSGNAYAEQQQINNTRPTVNVVAPDTIPEDDQHLPGKTQFGASHTRHVLEKDSHKKSKGRFGALFGGKDKREGRESPPDKNRLSRTGSVLNRGKHSQPTSPQQPPYPTSPEAQRSDQRSESISNYLREHDSSTEHLDETQFEQYYRRNEPQQFEGQYNTAPQTEQRTPVQYEEDAPRFQYPPPPPPGSQQQPPPPPQDQQQHYRQISHSKQLSPTARQEYQKAQADETDQQFFPYPGQTARTDRASAVYQEDQQSLRPPSQSSLAPPSPLAGGPPILGLRSPSSTGPPYPAQGVQPYNPSGQPTASQDTPSRQLVQGDSPVDQNPAPQLDMPSRDRAQRTSRVPEEQPPDQRFQDPRLRMSAQTHEQGRSTPPPTRVREDIANLDHQQLLAKYEELQAKYSKVKRYYFEREAQVTHLQNTVANQRLSMSKTSLDDAQYATRFERLNGAIQNVAFNIRKDWHRIPNWLTPACNRDACQVGTKEMTAVGRACISRWLYENIFQEIFHPGIDPVLSSQLKQMERTLRRTPVMLTDEQRDDLLTKVTTWRLTTCEGLHDILNARENEANTERLARYLAQRLFESLATCLSNPQPGLDDNLLTIISQTLSIASNMPLESRDVCVEYFFPGTPYSDTYMKLESGMTPLQNPGSAATREDPTHEDANDHKDDQVSIASTVDDSNPQNVEDQIREAVKSGTGAAAAGAPQTTMSSSGSNSTQKAEKTKKSFLSSFSGGYVGTGGNGNSLKSRPSASSASGRQGGQSADLAKQGADDASKDTDDPASHAWNIDSMTGGIRGDKIRFAVFLAVEVRGKAAKAEVVEGNGAGNGDKASQQQAGSAGAGNVPGQNNASTAAGGQGGTSGAAGTGGINVLFKAPVFGF